MRSALFTAAALLFAASAAHAQDSTANLGNASTQASKAAGYLAASGVQTAVGASAVPASVAGTASVAGGASAMAGGAASVGTGLGMIQAAGDSAAFSSRPLPVAKEVIVAPQPAPKVPYGVQQGEKPQ